MTWEILTALIFVTMVVLATSLSLAAILLLACCAFLGLVRWVDSKMRRPNEKHGWGHDTKGHRPWDF